ncbi:hypothetical protein GOBAR_DD12018 [Gossypium barbadense]|nr:hypothetical protein GOBAR_DD12018 [Gossypium barbadense]
MVAVLAALSVEGGEVEKWHINSDEGEEEIGRGMVVDLVGVRVSHHSFFMGDMWYQESFVRINVKMPEGDGGGRRRIGMDRNGRGTYHRLVYYRILLPPFATSNGYGQR